MRFLQCWDGVLEEGVSGAETSKVPSQYHELMLV